MFTADSGIAISKGKGKDVKGNVLTLHNGIWQPVEEFEYSDYPLVCRYNKNTIWYLIHETHNGNYKPRLFSLSGNIKKEIKLPDIFWDEKDYSMWTGISVLENGCAYLAGQKGNIIFYDTRQWHVIESPVKNSGINDLIAGDLHDVQMLSPEEGWAVGKQGIILHFKSGKWNIFPSPTNYELRSISMADRNSGWIVGDHGTILKYSDGKWIPVPTEFRVGFNSVKSVNGNKAWIVGNRSLLLEYDAGVWKENTSIRIFEDNFNGLDVIKSVDGKYKIWIIGNSGIYTNSQPFNFSFTDVTAQTSLRKEGRIGVFADFNNDRFPDIISVPEDGPVLLYENRGGKGFRPTTGNISSPEEKNSQTVSAADINNDGNPDLLKILDDVNYQLLFGNGDFSFRKSSKDNLSLNYISTDSYVNSSTFVDFDNDGNLDLYFSNYNNMDMLFRNDGSGKFTNVFGTSGIVKYLNKRSYGALFSDFNNDNLIDVLLIYKIPEEKKHLFLFINKGDFKFVNKEDTNFICKGAPSTYSAIAEDLNCDGYTDIVVFNNDEKLKVLINRGDASFYDATESSGLDKTFSHPDPGNGILNAADINNDGYPDLFIGSKLFLNSPECKFTEMGKYLGVDFTGNPSFADYDGDGDVDLYLGSSREALGKGDRAVLYRNNLIDKNYIKVELLPDISNRSGIGTKLFLEKYDKNGNLVNRYLKQAGLGASPIAQPDFANITFGLDSNMRYKLKTVFPSGVTINTDIDQTGKIYEITESSFYRHYSILLLKSINRTLLLLNWEIELIKLVVLLIIIRLLYGYGLKTKAGPLIRKWYLATSFIAMYFVLVHLCINESIIYSSFIAIGGTSVVAFIFIFLSVYIYEKKGSHYILHYRLHDIIGAGGMGKVYRATDTRNNKSVALKVLNSELLKDDSNRKALNSEGKLLSLLDHPNIVKIIEFGATNEQAFIAMEFLAGRTLAQYIEMNSPLPQELILSISGQILKGLDVIHKNNIIHRDLKSANIMFDEQMNVRIMDFGLSKSPLLATMTSLGSALGTLGFTAPEQITNLNVDKRADIFSFGVILYQMITAALPFSGENEISLIYSIFNNEPPLPSTINPNVSKGFDKIVMKCLDKEPEERYRSVEEIISDLELIEQ